MKSNPTLARALALTVLATFAILPVAANAWQFETIAHYQAIGTSHDLLIDNDGGLHVSFHHDPNAIPGSNLAYAYKGPGEELWSTEWPDVDDWNLVGRYNSIILAPDGSPHISYMYMEDFVYRGYLRYAYRENSTWQSVTLSTSQQDLVKGTDILLDNDNRPHIVWGDMNAGLIHTWQDADGWHSEQPIDIGFVMYH